MKRLLPEEAGQQDWAREVTSFKPSICHYDLFLGFEGDIINHGASRSNHWFYESWDTSDAIWAGAGEDPIQMMFVSFGSRKNPAHDRRPTNRHTGDMLVWAVWSSVAEFANGGADERPEEWRAFEQAIESSMIDFFKEKFPGLASLITYHELGTPLATAEFTRHEKGGFYGVETSFRRMLSEALTLARLFPTCFCQARTLCARELPERFRVACSALRRLIRAYSGNSLKGWDRNGIPTNFIIRS